MLFSCLGISNSNLPVSYHHNFCQRLCATFQRSCELLYVRPSYRGSFCDIMAGRSRLFRREMGSLLTFWFRQSSELAIYVARNVGVRSHLLNCGRVREGVLTRFWVGGIIYYSGEEGGQLSQRWAFLFGRFQMFSENLG